MTNEDLLKALTDRIDELLFNLKEPVNKYLITLRDLHSSDVSKDDAYRWNFARFYRLSRRKTDWQNHYFFLLESSKKDPNIKFDYVLRELQFRTGRIEPSFSSKLIATINPNLLVIDSIVLSVLGYRQPYTYQSDIIERLTPLHKSLTNMLSSYIYCFYLSNYKNKS